MMKRNYSILIISSIFLPLITSAQATPAPQADFCDRLSAIKIDTDKKIDLRIEQLNTKRGKITDTINQARSLRDNQKTTNRLRWDSIYESSVAKLRAKATTSIQKTAVEKYISIIVDAVSTRRTATNAALQGFRSGIDDSLRARNDALNTAISYFKKTVDAAFDTAETNCTQNIKPSLVRQNLKDALKSAKETYVKERTAAESLANNIAPLRESRKTAMASIVNNFKTAIEKARTDLKKILP